MTLVELLVVVGILASLVLIVLPPLLKARDISEKAVCQANIQVLQKGNQMYQREHEGFFAPGAPHMYPDPDVRRDPLVNKVRWFGQRESLTEPFSRSGGPLSPYLPGEAVNGCPSFRDILRGFEAGCGGYGYNNNFVGQLIIRRGARYFAAGRRWHLTGNRVEAFAYPDRTVAFTDTALVDGGLIEYPFCESPRWPLYDTEPRPSIHFRHLGKTNVVWLDTHVSSEKLTFSNDVMTGNPYVGSPIDYDVGWFGPRTNELFDCD